MLREYNLLLSVYSRDREKKDTEKSFAVTRLIFFSKIGGKLQKDLQ